MLTKKNYQNGQVLLVVILLITVVVTVGLSMATRSVVNLRLAVEEDESQRAFSAAEAGIEQTLLSDTAIENSPLQTESSFSTIIRPVNGANFLVQNGKPIIKDEGADVWLSNYSTDKNRNYNNPWSGDLRIYWGSSSDQCQSSPSTNTMAAIGVVVISGNRNNPTISNFAFDPCAARRSNNSFSPTSAGTTINGVTFAYSARINPVSNGLIARVIPFYANTRMAVSGAPVLPEQGTRIESTGTAGDVQRKIVVFRENPTLPVEFFSYTLLWPR